MQLRDLSALGRGYVLISVEGKNPEKFINLASIQGVILWDVEYLDGEKFMAKVPAAQVKSLRKVAQASRTRFRIRRKRGFPFILRRLRRRKTFIGGALLFIILLYNLSAFIWFIDWSSSEELQTLNPAEVLQLAAEQGLRPGVRKHNLPLRRIENTLEVALPHLAWATVEIKGTRAIIRLVEKKLPGEQAEGKPGHLLAAKDGVVDEMLVIDGRPLVKVGDTVTAGQVLVSGITAAPTAAEVGADESTGLPRLVRARGVVQARIWYEGGGEVALAEAGERLTGKKASRISLLVFDREIKLKGPSADPFPHYQKKETRHKLVPWRNWKVPVELLRITYVQAEPFHRELDREEARQVAREKAYLEIKGQLPLDCQILSRREEWQDDLPGVIRLKMVVETREEIGSFHPLL